MSSTLMPSCFNIRCNPSLRWKTVPFYALIVQRPREKPLSPRFNLPFDKNGDKKFLTPQRMFVAKKWGYRLEQGGVFGSIIPLALAIDP